MKSSRHIYGGLGGAHPNRIRALSPAAWFQPGVGVTGTLTASNWADQSGNGRDLAQGTAGNQPIYLPYSGTPYAYLPGVAGNYFSTPSAAANQITGDLDVKVRLLPDNWGAQWYALAKGNAAPQFSYFFSNGVTGSLYPILDWSANGTAVLTATATAIAPMVAGQAGWLRVTLDVDNGSGAYEVRFYYSLSTSVEEPTSWTQVGSTVSPGGTTSIHPGTSPVCVSGWNNGANNPFPGKIFRVKVANSIDGAAVVDFNPTDFAETSTNGATAVSSTTGETWTLNSTGAKPAQIVKSASLMGDGTNHKMATAAFTLNQPFTEYIVAKQITWTAGDYLTSGVGGAAGITQRTGTPKLGLNAGSGVADNTGAALGSKVILTAVFNGASSSLTVNNGTPTTGDPGAGNPGGLSLFSDDAGANYGNAQVYERIVFSGAHDAAERAVVQRYLASRHAIAL